MIQSDRSLLLFYLFIYSFIYLFLFNQDCPRAQGSYFELMTAKLSSPGVLFIAHLSNRFEVSHRAQQYHCRALCKFSKRFDYPNGSFGRTRFREIWVSRWVSDGCPKSPQPPQDSNPCVSGTIYQAIVLCMGSANERRRYIVTPPLTGRSYTQNDPGYNNRNTVLGTRGTMTSSNGNIFCVTGHLCGEFTGCPRWIPRLKTSDAELWCFLWPASE